MRVQTSAKARPRRRRASRTADPEQAWSCGRQAAVPPPFISIILLDGSEIWVSSTALSRSGCLHCAVDELAEAGYLCHGTPLTAPFKMNGDGKDGRFGPLSSHGLSAILTRLAVFGALPINEHPFDGGEC
jgi:hypothetical protein